MTLEVNFFLAVIIEDHFAFILKFSQKDVQNQQYLHDGNLLNGKNQVADNSGILKKIDSQILNLRIIISLIFKVQIYSMVRSFLSLNSASLILINLYFSDVDLWLLKVLHWLNYSFFHFNFYCLKISLL